MSDLDKMCGMWENEDKNGNKYFNGKLKDGTKMVMFVNSFKDKETSPDFYLYKDESSAEGKDLPI
jgi:hypothetical protein|tara:strand:+ start:815 stop:1009 length:195 start_codon:yes stop_codon:yes gene_type:complete